MDLPDDEAEKLLERVRTPEWLVRFRDKQLERLEEEGHDLDAVPFEGIELEATRKARDRYDPERYK